MIASNDVFKAIVADTSPSIVKGGWFPSSVVVKLSNNSGNSSEHDCVDITHVNHFAVLCVDSSEDEGDSLDFEMVNGPDTSCTVRELQGGESVEMHSN